MRCQNCDAEIQFCRVLEVHGPNVKPYRVTIELCETCAQARQAHIDSLAETAKAI